MPSRAPLRRACPLHESVPWPAICLRAAPSFVASIYLPRRTCDTLRLGSFSLRRLLDLLLVSSPADRPPARIRQIFISNFHLQHPWSCLSVYRVAKCLRNEDECAYMPQVVSRVHMPAPPRPALPAQDGASQVARAAPRTQAHGPRSPRTSPPVRPLEERVRVAIATGSRHGHPHCRSVLNMHVLAARRLSTSGSPLRRLSVSGSGRSHST
jgi:hypothetical protein